MAFRLFYYICAPKGLNNMSKSLLSLLFVLLLCAEARAEHPHDEYYPYAERERRQPMLLTDSALFYRAVQSDDDLFGRITDFNLPQIARSRRGQDYTAERTLFSGLDLSYRYASALRLLGAVEDRVAGIGLVPGVTGGAGGAKIFRFSGDVSLTPCLVSVRFTDRNYLAGARFAAAGTFAQGWSYSVAADARTGRDMYVEGVFTNAVTAALRLGKSFGEGHELALLVVVPPSLRGTRLSSTEEAFSLTGDRLYNPAWGFQRGKVRNSRVRRETVPLAAVTWCLPLSEATRLTTSLGVETGVRRYSALGWYDARTPMPDNYRYMPSYTGDRESDRAWRTGDARYTQIRWDELIAQNRMAGGQAVYTLEDRAERLLAVQADAAFSTVLDERLTLRYGFFWRLNDTRSYKQMRDLLGAEYVVDIDQYLIDDDTYGSLLQNDLRHPDRKIRRGDRFAYDYSLVVREAGVRLHAEYRSDRLRGEVAVSLGNATLFRRGHFEKELFPGVHSYGRSRRMRFTPYAISAVAGWAFTPRHYLGITGLACAGPPAAEDLFYQPQYNNRTVDDPTPERTWAAEAVYRLTGPVLEMQVTGFFTAMLDGIETRRYYDDMAGVFCDMAVTGIGRMAYGVEAAAHLRLSYRWSLSLAASAGRYKYMRDPQVTVLSDVDNTAVDTRAVSPMGGCETGAAPQLTACAQVGYFGPKGWGLRLSTGYAGRRFVEAAPLLRTDRIAVQGGNTPEAFAAFAGQERLDDAFTLDASLFKSFYFGRKRLTAALMLRNLTAGRGTIYSGYESLRVRRVTAGDQTLWQPHDTRYTYAYPRSFYLTISYRF